MTIISRLEVNNFRNLSKLEIYPCEQFNIIYGENGSGKTSLLEVIYHLGLGRSFRTRLFNRIIQNGCDEFSIFGKISSIPVGMQRFRNGELRVRIAEKDISLFSELTNTLPLQLINPDSYHLIDSGAKVRRQFINWGVFHVKQETFMGCWKKMRRGIKQRNAILKVPNVSKNEIALWDKELVTVSNLIKEMKEEYIKEFLEVLFEILHSLLEIKELKFEFYPGWDSEKKTFEEVLNESLDRDIQFGYTHFGPHRADLRITVGKYPARDVLSRGQQKLLVCAMKLAQAKLLCESNGKKCVLLIDDLVSELDSEKRQKICKIIEKLELQTFVTGTDIDALEVLFDSAKTKVFHLVNGA